MCSGFKPKARFYGLLGLKNRHFYAVPGTAGKSSSADKPRGSPKAPENSRIFSVIQILQGTTILRLLPEVLLAPVLDGYSLLRENREQLEESLTLMLQDRTRFMGRQRQINPQQSDFYA